MLLMFERGIKDGITQAIHRYAWANNKYMNERFDSTKKSQSLPSVLGWQIIFMVG